MQIRYKTLKSIYIFAGVPESYPLGFPVDGPEQIPILNRVSDTSVPANLCAFDQPSRANPKLDTALHFYRADETFQAVLESPHKYVSKISEYKAILTPDCSMTLGMSPSKRAHQTQLSRAVGAVWQSRGLTVIPSLRWADQTDYDIVCSGIPVQSVFAISSYGCMRDPLLRENFENGAMAIVERLRPSVLLVYGHISAELLQTLKQTSQVIVYLSPTASRNNAKTIRGSRVADFDF